MINSTATLPTIEQDFNKLFNQYSKKLCNQLYYKFGDYEKAQDITQESFIKLWNNRKKINCKKMKGYLFVIANNAFLNEIKHQKVVQKFQNQSIKKEVSILESPDYILEEKEFQAKLERSIAQLPIKQRSVFIMNRMEQKTYKEIAIELNLTTKAIEKRMQLAMLALRKNVGKKI